ncbi:AGAP008416-PA-like protein [Anopheles sinensis]|uniref:AGAP008416-PA-like protein n=1 Tax=Anopheles sinensis TaxID=74873 RepID=A0A084VMA2_ANOSI|nr:AGAP008416-PA-like protein [Anopheles sinensis]
MEKENDSKEPKQEFHCEIDGCKQSFTTEVHRNVHTKKHDLSLNLEMPLKGAAGGLFADQTPTPTRLIGKCEEVGLFEDLKKVNPFDETFRRAVESGTGGSPLSADLQSPSTTALSVPCCRIGEGETLHTPHIFPSNIDRNAHDDPPGNDESVAKQRSKPKATGTSRTKQDLANDAGVANTGPMKRAAVKRKAPAMVDILPKPTVVQSSQVSKTIPLLIIPSGKPASQQVAVAASDSGTASDPIQVKEKLKQHLAKVRESGKGKKEKPATIKRSEGGEEDKKNSSKLSKPIDLTKSSDEQADLKHERWKAAAKRYRLRVKNSQDQQHQRNIQLEEENLRLRTELAALKHTHRNCSITREMKLAAALAQGTAHTIAATVGGIQELGAGTVVYNSVDPQHPIALSTPQQRLITSHIIDSHSMNRNPIFIVIGAGTDSNGQVASSSALPEKGVQNR